MSFDGTKLIYSDGRPQWLMPDGSFIPVRHGNDGTMASGRLYLRDRAAGETRLICG